MRQLWWGLILSGSVGCGRIAFVLDVDARPSDSAIDAAVDAGPPGMALHFDGVSDYVNFPASTNYVAATGSTWELWFRPDAPPTSTAIGPAQTMLGFQDTAICEDTYVGFGGEVSAPERDIAFTVDGVGLCGARDMQAASYYPSAGFQSRWYHLAAVRDVTAGEKRIYLDGVLVAKTPSTAAPITRSLVGSAGRWYDGSARWYFAGALDEIRVYSRVLAASEISAHYNGGTGQLGDGAEDKLVAGWHFDEGVGATAADYGPSGLTATVSGAQWVTGIVPQQ